MFQPVQVPGISQNRDHEVHHEEYVDEDDEEIGYHEDVVISESNHTIPNYDETSEIQMLTEAANNSLRTMEEHLNPPKKRRSRKKKIEEQGFTEVTRPKKRRRPTHLYFNELGEPTPGRAQSLLTGLENLNLPIATAGTAPMSPLDLMPEPPAFPSRREIYTTLAPEPVMQHPQKMSSPGMPLPLHTRMTTPHKPMPELSIPQMVSPQMVSPRLKSPNVASPKMKSPSVISPQMISPKMVSVGQQASQLSPRTISATQKKHPLLSTILSVTSAGTQGLASSVSLPSGMVSPHNHMARIPRNITPVSFRFPSRPKIEGQPQAPVTSVTPNRQGSFADNCSVTPAAPRPHQFPIQEPRQQQIAHIPTQVTSPSHIPIQQITRVYPPQSTQSGPSGPMQRNIRPDAPNPSYPTTIDTARTPVRDFPRFQKMVSSISPNKQPVSAQTPPASPAAILPSENPVNVFKSAPQHAGPSVQAASNTSQFSELMSPSISERMEVKDTLVHDVNGNAAARKDTVPPQSTNEPKPKIQELIKSELLAAAWESRQPVPPLSLSDKVIETNTISSTISRVEEHLKQVAIEAPKSRPEMSRPSGKVHLPKNTAVAQAAPITRPQVPIVDSVKLTSQVPVQGSTLPPISTLQTKLPPGLVPSTLPLTSSATEFNMHITSSIASSQSSTTLPSPITASDLESPPVTENKDAGSVLPGQIPVPRGALISPISSSGLCKDPMLSGPNLSVPPTQQTNSQPTSNVLKSPTHPLMAGKLPTPFPLAFAPGLPPVGLVMQPIPPLGLVRPGMTPQARSSGEVLSSRNLPAPTSIGIPNPSIPVDPSTSQLRSPTADKHKVLSSTLQSPAVSQPSPLDLVMEVMKKEVSGNAQGFLQGQSQKDFVRPGILPEVPVTVKREKGDPTRFPTPGPTMEMLMAIMQREFAAAQIQAQVAALHAAHAQAHQAQVSQTVTAHNPSISVAASVPQSARPPVTGSQIAQLQAQARATVQTAPLRSSLLPVNTIMPTTSLGTPPISNQLKSPIDVPSAGQLASQHPRPQVSSVSSPQGQVVEVCMPSNL